jgi:uncharacterized protein
MVLGVAILGVIADTHGLLRPEVRTALASVDRILHAGDLDDRRTWQWLATLAPLSVVRGNCDRGAWAAGLPDHETIQVDGFVIHMLHDLGRLAIDPAAAGIGVVVHGHTHQPQSEVRGGVLYFNPGSAGPRRHGVPVSLGLLHLSSGGVRGQVITLERG